MPKYTEQDGYSMDITAPDHPVQVEIDADRKVLYVHVDGISALRICRLPGPTEVVVKWKGVDQTTTYGD
jgi:hypothetical protein